MVIDEWMISAMADETVVAELLVRLKHSKTASVSAKSHPTLAPPPLPRWGTKQSRSRLTSAATAVVSRRKEEADSTRCSPTTPLSWSGGASPSPTADGCEDSSHHTVLSHHAVATATGSKFAQFLPEPSCGYRRFAVASCEVIEEGKTFLPLE